MGRATALGEVVKAYGVTASDLAKARRFIRRNPDEVACGTLVRLGLLSERDRGMAEALLAARKDPKMVGGLVDEATRQQTRVGEHLEDITKAARKLQGA